MTLTDMLQGFTIESKKHKSLALPVEDSFAFDRKKLILAVADGVTRDIKEKPSPARVVADLFTGTFTFKASPSERAIRDAFLKANDAIHAWNKINIPNPDYAPNDFAGCVASGAVVNGNEVYYGFICDCGIALFNKNGKLIFRTENQGPDKHDKFIWQDNRLKGIDWKNPEARRIIRKFYRNNPSEVHSFGVLTGEPKAMDYVHVGKRKLNNGDLLLAYTDGLELTIFSKEFSEKVKKGDLEGMKKLCQANVRSEGTLVYYLHK